MRLTNTTMCAALSLVLAAGSAPAGAAAGQGVWTPSGPSMGGNVSTLAVAPSDPQVAYAGFSFFWQSTVFAFRTADGGESWSPAGGGFPVGFRPRAITVDPADASVATAIDDYFGLYRTTDGGATWTASSEGLPPDAGLVAVAAVSSDTLVTGGTGGLYRSADGGATWTQVAGSEPFDEVLSLAVSAGTLYAAVRSGAEHRVHTSTDGGATWTPTGLTGGGDIAAIAASPDDPAVAYAAIDAEGTFRTMDGGATWTLRSTDPVARTLTVRPGSPGSLLAGTDFGLFASNDGAGSWTSIDADLPAFAQIRAAAFRPDDPDRLYVGVCCDAGGVYTSSDGGATFDLSITGFTPNVWTEGAVLDPKDPKVVYAPNFGWQVPVTLGGPFPLYRSTDGGARWSPFGAGIPPRTQLIEMAVDASGGDLMVAAAGEAGLFRSTDHGATWQGKSFPNMWINTVAIAPSDPRFVYAAAQTGIAVPSGTIYSPTIALRSTDGGTTWSTSTTGLPVRTTLLDLTVDPTNPNTVYVAALDFGVFKSTDGGQTWFNSSAGLTNVPVLSLAIDPSNPGTLYAGGGFGLTGIGNELKRVSGLYKTTTGGLAWLRTGLQETDVNSIAVDPSNPLRVYASGYTRTGNAALRSTDGGATWTGMSVGLNPAEGIAGLVVSRSSGRVYGQVPSRGVWFIDT